MSSHFGKTLHVTLFGESHGPAIGVTVEGIPAGHAPDWDAVRRMMARRAPGQAHATPRQEADAFTVLSGVYDGHLTGAPVTAVIENTNQHSADYGEALDLPRPGHADWTGFVRSGGHGDHRGGGHFSGRLTAPIVFAGALTAGWLEAQGVTVSARITRIGGVTGDGLDDAMIQEIEAAHAAGDSVGGVIECTVQGLRPGLGAPFFDSVESTLSHLLFSIPGVKGVEFGLGFAMGSMRGSACNDEMAFSGGAVTHLTNHSGGALGGLTNGEPIIFRVAMRPTSSIARAQRTVSLSRGEDAVLETRGRHDPCIALRAVPVVEAMAALAVGELMLCGR